MFGFFSAPDKQRQRLLAATPDGPLREYLKQPFPDQRQLVSDTKFLALDFETTGLDAKHEAILSAGYTLVRCSRVVMSECGHHLVQVNKPIPEKSVVIHKITDDRAQQGMHLHNLMEILLPKMAGRVLLVHFKNVEQSFLNAACQQIYGHKIPMMIADTMQIEKKRLERRHQSIVQGQLRLFNLREQYGLPRYNAHSALEDAIATAELFLAQVDNISGDKPLKLNQILS